MAIKSSDQVTIVDVTDAYSVILTSESHTFAGSINAALNSSATTQVVAMRGAEQLPAVVIVSEIIKPAGVSVTSDGKTPAPTLTITVSTAVKEGGVIKIPVHIGDVVLNKEFTFAIAFKGATGSQGVPGTSVSIVSTSVTYQKGNSGTVKPTGSWTDEVPATNPGEYLWTKTVVNYSDKKHTEAYTVSKHGNTGATGSQGIPGTSVKITSKSIQYASSASGTTPPSSGWGDGIPAVPQGQFLWTRTTVNYSDSTSTVSYSVARQGEKGDKGNTGAPGADALTLSISSSGGTIFKNTAISTVLTAHVYRGGAELSESQISTLGTIKWYKDGGSIAVTTGITFTVSAGDVANKAVYSAQLEG